MRKTRKIDPFFYEAINQPFLHPKKTAFVMDGGLGLGKSSNFVMLGAYTISQCVNPIKKGDRWVRESKWAAIRESEESSASTINQLITESIFSPEVMSLSDSPVQQKGSHPTRIIITHDLPDGTLLEMTIECHGFNNPKAHNRLRTHEFMGAMIFEAQGIPFSIFEVAMQRCGRFRTEKLVIEREIDGKTYQLTGVTGTAIVLADINIPARPHSFYKKYYDVNDKSKLPYMFVTPPSPLLYKPVEQVSDEILDKYPVTRFEGNKVVWLPNPSVYHMTRHFEERDENGDNIPWSGYDYWFTKLHLTDSDVRRYILGKPDKIGGEAAVYQFSKDENSVREMDINPNLDIRVGFDPGGHAAIEMMQVTSKKDIYIFKEMYFEPSDRVSTRQIFADFFLPYCEDELQGHKIIITADPASSWLGKSVMMAQSETVLTIMQDEIAKLKKPRCTYIIEQCKVQNQDVEGRINALGYYIDQRKLIIHPEAEMMITGLIGGYCKLQTRSGIISDTIDKNSVYSHPIEAAQYPVVNILYEHKQKRRKTNGKQQIKKLRTRR